MKERARVAEKAVKAHEAELEKLRNAAMSDQEKAVSEAEARGRQTALTEAGRKIAVAEIRAAAVGKDTEALNSQLEFLNVDTVLGEDGEVDAEKVARFVAGVADSGKPAVPGVPIGARQMPTEPSLADQLAEAQAKGDTKRFIQLQSGQLTRLPIPK
jgi:hypothetical protein